MGVRKSAATLTADEKARFTGALLTLKANGGYDPYVRQHRDLFFESIHTTAFFLPWHREFLRRLEVDLQAIDPSVSIPYWNFAVDRAAGPPIFAADLMGGNGEPGTRRVTTGPFAFSTGQWPLTVIDPPGDPGPALRRNLRQPADLPTVTRVNGSLAQLTYPSFRENLEVMVHNIVHGWVGGSAGQTTSPNDPVFFLLHCNVDRLWSRWQELRPAVAPYEGDGPGRNLNDPMVPWANEPTPPTPARVVNHRALGYTYDDDPPADGGVPPDGAGVLTIDGVPLQASIGAAGEVDRYRFVVPAAGPYVIETEGPTDVVMSLFGPNSLDALVTDDDDSGQDRNARIESSLTAGTYFVTVRHFSSRASGSYRISVRRGAEPPLAIPEIAVNGPGVQGEILAANESDFYTFTATVTSLYTLETSGATDTFLTLFGPNSQTLVVAQDDDSGPGQNSRVVADLAAGVYFVRIRHFSPRGTGAYRISIAR